MSRKHDDTEYEVEISALIDGELSPADVLGVIDHLVHSPGGRDFYRQVRGLEGALKSAHAGSRAGELPPDLWSRIDQAAQTDSTDVARVRRWHGIPRWALKAAATLLVAVGALVVGHDWLRADRVSDQVVRVQLEENRGHMDEDRFVQLTAELLRADRQYHLKMQEIMAAVNQTSFIREGSSEGAAPMTELYRASRVDSATPGVQRAVWD